MTPTMRTVMRVIPFVMLPVTINMPAAMLCYWATSNVVSLFQVGFLRLPGMRQRLNIPEYAAHSKAHVELKKKGFVEGFKESQSLFPFFFIVCVFDYIFHFRLNRYA